MPHCAALPGREVATACGRSGIWKVKKKLKSVKEGGQEQTGGKRCHPVYPTKKSKGPRSEWWALVRRRCSEDSEEVQGRRRPAGEETAEEVGEDGWDGNTL